MSHSKYVRSKNDDVILFSETVNHKDVINRENCKSAGFFSVEPDPNEVYGIKVVCFGNSVSLKLDSNPEDAVYVKSVILNVPVYLILMG